MAELQRFLDQLPEKLQRNVLRGTMRAAAKVPMAEAKRTAPVDAGGPHPGALRDSLRIKTSARGGVVKATVSAGSKVAYYARWVEYGTAAHFIKPKRRKSLFFAGLAREIIHHPGAKKKPFMRPALDRSAQAALAAAGTYLRKRLTKEGLDVPSEA